MIHQVILQATPPPRYTSTEQGMKNLHDGNAARLWSNKHKAAHYRPTKAPSLSLSLALNNKKWHTTGGSYWPYLCSILGAWSKTCHACSRHVFTKLILFVTCLHNGAAGITMTYMAYSINPIKMKQCSVSEREAPAMVPCRIRGGNLTPFRTRRTWTFGMEARACSTYAP